MKKFFRMIMLLAMMAAACVSMGSCSSSDDDGTFSEQRVEEYITGYKWYLDHNKRSEFRFYRNRLVTCMSGSGSITSGSLTWVELLRYVGCSGRQARHHIHGGRIRRIRLELYSLRVAHD